MEQKRLSIIAATVTIRSGNFGLSPQIIQGVYERRRLSQSCTYRLCWCGFVPLVDIGRWLAQSPVFKWAQSTTPTVSDAEASPGHERAIHHRSPRHRSRSSVASQAVACVACDRLRRNHFLGPGRCPWPEAARATCPYWSAAVVEPQNIRG